MGFRTAFIGVQGDWDLNFFFKVYQHVLEGFAARELYSFPSPPTSTTMEELSDRRTHCVL